MVLILCIISMKWIVLQQDLKLLGIEVDEIFLMQFILNFISSWYETFQMNYNIMKDKWNLHILQSKLVKSELRIK